MADELAPLLQLSVPVYELAVSNEEPQSFTTVTTGALMVVRVGAATPFPEGLVHPLTVCVTVYVPGVVTWIDVDVCPVLHNKEPVKPAAVSVELLQSSTTVTEGAATDPESGAASAVAGWLVQPFTVCVTV